MMVTSTKNVSWRHDIGLIEELLSMTEIASHLGEDLRTPAENPTAVT